LKLADSTLLLPGDRFIIRQFSPVVTIGGGIVMDNAAPAKVKRKAAHLDFLNILKAGSRADVLRARVNRAETLGITLADAVAQTGSTRGEIISTVSAISTIAQIGDSFISASGIQQISAAMVATLNDFHKQNHLVSGMSKEELRERLPVHPSLVFERVIEEASKAKKVELVGDLVRLPGRGVLLKDEEAESKNIIETAFASAGLKVPAMKDVLNGLKVDKVRAQKIVTLLLREKILVKISEDLVFHSASLAALKESLAAEKKKSATIDVARFKDLAGVSRKYAIPLLEYLDRERVTRRVGDERVIL
ncbi:MAG TPA: SelB C-terminal domain-containing protein, partial [Terriglobales bacterium]|nr:SelB C-terminal domain-containing protein [Terriglobales bacterium]